MKRSTTKKADLKAPDHRCGNPDDLIEPVESLKKLHGAVTLLASLGSPERECYDTDHIIRFCELIENQLESVIQELVALQEAYIQPLPKKLAQVG
ncbi:MAG: hypothetical protein P0121_00845 [Nitrospira sp.]|nr:hypothetical protein [Nitrospira sp.]